MGNWKRGTGILNNELYIGHLVWNRQKYHKNPQNQKRVGRLNMPAKVDTVAVPELQIIDLALWDRVKARQAAIRDAMNPAGVKNGATRPRTHGDPAICFPVCSNAAAAAPAIR